MSVAALIQPKPLDKARGTELGGGAARLSGIWLLGTPRAEEGEGILSAHLGVDRFVEPRSPDLYCDLVLFTSYKSY